MKSYKLIIFDLDDTLFDYEATEKYAVNRACETLGISYIGDLYFHYKKANNLTRDEFKTLTADNIHQFRISRALRFFDMINNVGINPQNFIERYLEFSTVGVLIKGVQETLESLAGVLKVVATNGTNYPRLNKLEGSQISKYFDAFFSAENLGLPKSNPEYFLKIIQQYEMPKEEVLIVGDDFLTDVKSAMKLGVDCCWFNHRQKEEDIEIPDNVYVIDRFEEIVYIVKGGSHA